MSRPIFAVSISAAALALGAPLPASAECAAPVGGLVVCTGSDADGLANETGGLLVEIRPGATVEAPGDAIALGADAQVLNEGAVSGGDEGIVGGAGLTVENAGSIEAADKAIDTDGEDGLTVVNTGTVTAGDKGIRAGDGSGASLDNAGVVEAGDEGFEAGDDAAVTNREGGVIRAVEDAVQVGRGAFLANDGLIESTGPEGDGIDIDDGTILNAGIIRAADGAGIDFDGEGFDDGPVGEATVDNSGTIEGLIGVQVETGGGEDPANAAEQSVFNEGVIRGTSGVAIDLGDGADLVVTVVGDSLIDGATLLGAGDDALLFHLDPGAVGSSTFGLFDGGEGADEVRFNRFTADALRAAAVPGGFSVSVRDGASGLRATLLGFESFAFDDTTLSAQEVAGVALAPIPLPAGWGLLAAGLGALGLARRRRT